MIFDMVSAIRYKSDLMLKDLMSMLLFTQTGMNELIHASIPVSLPAYSPGGNMEIKRESQGDVAILRLAGRIDTSNAPLLEEELDRVISSGSRKVLLVMHDVSYISSGGLRVLLITAKKLKGPEDRFGLSRVSPEVYKILKLSGFTTIFPISETEEEGIAGW